MLDLESLQWTELTDFGLPSAIRWHTLSVAGPYQIALIGGYDGKKKLNSVMVYNTLTSTWTKDQRLPTEVVGNDGLCWHEAVEIRNGNRMSKIICLGGNANGRNSSRKILEFDVTT